MTVIEIIREMLNLLWDTDTQAVVRVVRRDEEGVVTHEATAPIRRTFCWGQPDNNTMGLVIENTDLVWREVGRCEL
jgi:hypothetical protein